MQKPSDASGGFVLLGPSIKETPPDMSGGARAAGERMMLRILPVAPGMPAWMCWLLQFMWLPMHRARRIPIRPKANTRESFSNRSLRRASRSDSWLSVVMFSVLMGQTYRPARASTIPGKGYFQGVAKVFELDRLQQGGPVKPKRCAANNRAVHSGSGRKTRSPPDVPGGLPLINS